MRLIYLYVLNHLFCYLKKKTVFLPFDSSFFLLKGSFEKPRKKNKVFIERLIENLVLTFEIVCNDYSCLNIWAIEIYVQLVTKNVIILWNSVLFELGTWNLYLFIVYSIIKSKLHSSLQNGFISHINQLSNILLCNAKKIQQSKGFHASKFPFMIEGQIRSQIKPF